MVPNIFEALGKLSSLASAKAYADVQPIIADLMDKANAMNRDNQALSEKVAKLEKEVARFKDFSTTAKKYQPNTEDTGVVTYVLKAPANDQEKAHRFCANCFHNAKVRYLQPLKDTELLHERHGWFRVHLCQECSGKLTFQFVQPYNQPQVQRYRSDFY